MLPYLIAILLLVSTAYLIRLISLLPFYKSSSQYPQLPDTPNAANKEPLHIFIFLGSGGHTGEMLGILSNYKTTFLRSGTHLYVGYSDIESRERFRKICPDGCEIKYFQFVKAREVGAGFISSIKSIVLTLVTSLVHVIQIRRSILGHPHLILLNGPGTCCILTLWFRLIDLVLLVTPSSHIVYIESLARIDALSLTGRILYYAADLFIVQWPELREYVAPRAQYFGILT